MPGATTQYGFPYPVGGDPLGDGDNSIQALAEAVEAWIQVVVKGATESVSSSTTYQQDDDLEFPVVDGGRYIVDVMLIWESSASASGFKARFGMPAGSKAYGASVSRAGAGINTNAVNDNDVPSGGDLLIGYAADGQGAAAPTPMSMVGTYLLEAGDDGTCHLSWAQNTSHATATKLFAGSWLRVQRVG